MVQTLYFTRVNARPTVPRMDDMKLAATGPGHGVRPARAADRMVRDLRATLHHPCPPEEGLVRAGDVVFGSGEATSPAEGATA